MEYVTYGTSVVLGIIIAAMIFNRVIYRRYEKRWLENELKRLDDED